MVVMAIAIILQNALSSLSANPRQGTRFYRATIIHNNRLSVELTKKVNYYTHYNKYTI